MNENKFSGMADNYDKYRPSYPDKFIDCLFAEAGFREDSVIADIGAGAGILTELLAKRGGTVYAVEPNPDMRGAAEKRLAAYINAHIIDASAENTGLDANSVDFITVAQAFHWFDKEKFRLECKRILRAGGKAVIVWNDRQHEDDDVTISLRAINKKCCPEFIGFAGGSFNSGSAPILDFYMDDKYEYREFLNETVYDCDGFIGRSLSSSYALKKSDERYESYIDELNNIFNKYNENGYIKNMTVTKSYSGLV